MTREEVIASLRDQARDKASLSNEPGDIFDYDRQALMAAAATLEVFAPGWISVKNRLPEEGQTVLVLDKWGHIRDRTLKTIGNGFVCFTPDGMQPGRDITHWKPMPEPPKER